MSQLPGNLPTGLLQFNLNTQSRTTSTPATSYINTTSEITPPRSAAYFYTLYQQRQLIDRPVSFAIHGHSITSRHEYPDWQELDAYQRRPYEEEAEQDRIRYERELEARHRQVGNTTSTTTVPTSTTTITTLPSLTLNFSSLPTPTTTMTTTSPPLPEFKPFQFNSFGSSSAFASNPSTVTSPPAFTPLFKFNLTVDSAIIQERERQSDQLREQASQLTGDPLPDNPDLDILLRDTILKLLVKNAGSSLIYGLHDRALRMITYQMEQYAHRLLGQVVAHAATLPHANDEDYHIHAWTPPYRGEAEAMTRAVNGFQLKVWNQVTIIPQRVIEHYWLSYANSIYPCTLRKSLFDLSELVACAGCLEYVFGELFSRALWNSKQTIIGTVDLTANFSNSQKSIHQAYGRQGITAFYHSNIITQLDEFASVELAMEKMNQQHWYFDLNKVKQYATEFGSGQRMPSSLDTKLRDGDFQLLQFYGHRPLHSKWNPLDLPKSIRDGLGGARLTFMLIRANLYDDAELDMLLVTNSNPVGDCELGALIECESSEVVASLRLHFTSDGSPVVTKSDISVDKNEVLRNEAREKLLTSLPHLKSQLQYAPNAVRTTVKPTQAVEDELNQRLFAAFDLPEFIGGFDPTMYQLNHPIKARRLFTITLIDTAMIESGLQPLPTVLLQLISEYHLLPLPYLPDEADLVMSAYSLEGVNPVEKIRYQSRKSAWIWDHATSQAIRWRKNIPHPHPLNPSTHEQELSQVTQLDNDSDDDEEGGSSSNSNWLSNPFHEGLKAKFVTDELFDGCRFYFADSQRSFGVLVASHGGEKVFDSIEATHIVIPSDTRFGRLDQLNKRADAIMIYESWIHQSIKIGRLETAECHFFKEIPTMNTPEQLVVSQDAAAASVPSTSDPPFSSIKMDKLILKNFSPKREEALTNESEPITTKPTHSDYGLSSLAEAAASSTSTSSITPSSQSASNSSSAATTSSLFSPFVEGRPIELPTFTFPSFTTAVELPHDEDATSFAAKLREASARSPLMTNLPTAGFASPSSTRYGLFDHVTTTESQPKSEPNNEVTPLATRLVGIELNPGPKRSSRIAELDELQKATKKPASIKTPLTVMTAPITDLAAAASSTIQGGVMEEGLAMTVTPDRQTGGQDYGRGLFKLPQSVTSALASDFLVKREIRDLGVTCRSMLRALHLCDIQQPITIRVAIERLKRQGLVADSAAPRTRGASAINSHTSQSGLTPNSNWLIGRFRVIDCELISVTDAEVEYVTHLHCLIDARMVTLRLPGVRSCSNAMKKKLVPIRLPPSLQELYVADGSFIAPTDLILPESLTTLVFGSSFVDQDANRLLVLPNTITNLEIHCWTDSNGRYRDLLFPTNLKRLVLTTNIEKADFDFTNWQHLPASCINLDLRVVVDHYARSRAGDRTKSEQSQTAPESYSIRIPSCIRQLRIIRHRLSGQPIPLLDLTQATQLTSLVTDSLARIEWPGAGVTETIDINGQLRPPCGLDHSCQLIALKVNGLSRPELLQATSLPHSIRVLDLSECFAWDRDAIPNDDYESLHRLLPNLTQLFLISQRDTSLPTFLQRLNRFGQYLSNCHITSLIRLNGHLNSYGVTESYEYHYYECVNGLAHTSLILRLNDQQFKAKELIRFQQYFDTIPI